LPEERLRLGASNKVPVISCCCRVCSCYQLVCLCLWLGRARCGLWVASWRCFLLSFLDPQVLIWLLLPWLVIRMRIKDKLLVLLNLRALSVQ